MFEWTKGNANSCVITIYPNNFTLNNVAAQYFNNVDWCMIGIDNKNKRVAFKPVLKKDIDLNIIDPTNLHKIFIGKGYARISNKAIIGDLSNLVGYDFNGQKFEAKYDAKERLLIIHLDHQMQKGE